ncbi:MAG TPA: hypothetical protein VK875_08090 [Euzebyales bacterium]|nr:hypothetical protein [Euzebyales bacterium]
MRAVAYAILAISGALGVGVPVVLSFAMGERSAKLLVGLDDWMRRNNAVIMAVLCGVIVMKLVADALGGLTP